MEDREHLEKHFIPFLAYLAALKSKIAAKKQFSEKDENNWEIIKKLIMIYEELSQNTNITIQDVIEDNKERKNETVKVNKTVQFKKAETELNNVEEENDSDGEGDNNITKMITEEKINLEKRRKAKWAQLEHFDLDDISDDSDDDVVDSDVKNIVEKVIT